MLIEQRDDLGEMGEGRLDFSGPGYLVRIQGSVSARALPKVDRFGATPWTRCLDQRKLVITSSKAGTAPGRCELADALRYPVGGSVWVVASKDHGGDLVLLPDCRRGIEHAVGERDDVLLGDASPTSECHR
jgi:hypothetical protein